MPINQDPEFSTSQTLAKKQPVQDTRIPDSLRSVAFIVESSDDAIIGKQLDGTILTWNSGAERIYGYTAQEAIGRSVSFLTCPDRPNEIPRILEQISHGERVAHFETVRVRKDGQLIDVSLTISPIKDAHGKIIGASTIARDITSQKQAERELHTRARQQAAVAELGQKALSGTSPQELMEEAVKLIAEIFEIGYCGVFEYNLGEDKAHLRVGHGWNSHQFQSLTWEPGENSLWKFVLKWNKAVILKHLISNPQVECSPQLRELGDLTSVCAPISEKSHTFGVLAFFSRGQTVFQTEDSYFLQGVANILATAIERKWSEESRSRLLERLMSAQEQERRWLARELHDETGQSLTSLLVGLRMIVDARNLRTAREQADRLRQITAQTLHNIGRLARGLHPSILDDLGLVVAINRYAADYTSSYGIATEIISEELEQTELPAPIEITLYRIFQEALTNVAKHAQAQKVSIRLICQNNTVMLAVNDDGLGFDIEAVRRTSTGSLHLGLYSMQERAGLLGGHLTIASSSSTGTTITAVIPLTSTA